MANADPGLCVNCEHSRVLVSARGSSFYLCQLHNREPRFPKYPRLPVLACEGFVRTGGAASARESPDAGRDAAERRRR